MMRLVVTLVVLAFTLVAMPAYAVNPEEVLSDPALEERARVISAKLRCLVCQNQSIDDSDAQLAKDLRILVRERLVGGDTNEAAIDFIVARYGEYVLLQPRLGLHTILLWLTPALALGLGTLALVIMRRQRPALERVKALDDEEAAALKKLLDKP